jgi:hypothetical protein
MPPPNRSDRLAGLPDAYVECRAFGHNWTTELGYGWRDRAGVIQASGAYVRQRCDRCGMAVERHFDAFYLMAEPSRYTPPKGYVLNGSGRGDWRQETRRELFTRRIGPPPRRRQRR